MVNKIFYVLLISILYCAAAKPQDSAKIPLDHSVYDSWKRLEKQKISDDGKWILFEVNPQKGNGYLYLYNTETEFRDSIARGSDAYFSPNSDFVSFRIKPQ